MRSAVVAILILVAVPAVCAAERARVDLNGTWDFRLDPQNHGEARGWQSSGVAFERTITVPGAWQAQKVGEPKGALRNDYAGAAWYRRIVAVPAAWRGKSVRLRIGGAHRFTTLYMNGRRIAEHRGFSAPFVFDVTDAVRPGEDNVIALQIVNPGEVPLEGPREQKPVHPTGMLNYIGNWGGIYGNVELQASEPTWVERVYVRPDVEQKVANFVVTVQNREARAVAGEVRVSVGSRQGRARVQVEPGGHADVEVAVAIPDARLWSPEQPHLYTAAIALLQGGRETDRMEERFGMRQLQTRGNVLLLNGRPLYLRGYGDDNIEVLTGFPPSSRAVYLERLRQVRAFGFNAVRFHSMTPPEEFFHAADEVGLFVMAELPAAYTQYVLPHRDFLRQELRDVVLAYRNRPSLLSLAFGNEFNLSWLDSDAERKLFLETVDGYYRLAKSLHPDGLVLSNDGYVMRPTDLVSHFGGGLPDLPVVRHEFGEYYCSLPDISLLDKFTGVLVPEWLHVKKRWVSEHGLADQYAQYVHNSQRLQQLGRKFQIERVRHRQDITGYHYWLIVDFPGGTGEGDSWEEGWFDYFWQPKSITPQEGQTINSAVLPLIGTGVKDRTFWSDTARTVDITVSNYGDKDLRDAPLTWTLLADGKAVASGADRITVPMGQVATVDQITVGPLTGNAARKLDLVVEVDGAHANSWSFWMFPRGGLLDRVAAPVYSTVKWAGIKRLYPFVQEGAPPPGADALLLTSALDDVALQYLRNGGRVWLMAERGQTQARQEVAFFPAAGGAVGTVVRDHPALHGFPHQGFGDLQFFNLMDGAVPLPLDKWVSGFQPIMGGIRTTAGFLSKSKDLSRVGYVFEARVGAGRLLVTSLRFREHLDEAFPEAIYLFDRLLRYATGADFAPTMEPGTDQLQALMPPR
ncbi:MAG: glycoside hydrolase family 2 protein [Vicinamibacterales bacterium]